MTSNFYLSDLLEPFRIFNGVFSLDRFIAIKNIKKGVYIVNTENASVSRGGHWILISFIYTGNIEIFDSLALSYKLLPQKLVQFCRKNSKNVIFSKIGIQHLLSKNCGLYCVGRVLSIILREKLYIFLKYFSKHLEKNDRIIVRVISRLSKKVGILGSKILKKVN